MTDERSEFEKDLQIDVDRLDVEAALQGELFYKWAERSLEATRERDRAKLALDVLEAELDSAIRKNPEDFDLPKVTESAISSCIKEQSEWQEAQEEYLDARRDSALLDQAVQAMEQRKRMIEVLVTLHGQEYFAGPSVPHDLMADYQEKRVERNMKVVELQKKKTRTRKKGG